MFEAQAGYSHWKPCLLIKAKLQKKSWHSSSTMRLCSNSRDYAPVIDVDDAVDGDGGRSCFCAFGLHKGFSLFERLKLLRRNGPTPSARRKRKLKHRRSQKYPQKWKQQQRLSQKQKETRRRKWRRNPSRKAKPHPTPFLWKGRSFQYGCVIYIYIYIFNYTYINQKVTNLHLLFSKGHVRLLDL